MKRFIVAAVLAAALASLAPASAGPYEGCTAYNVAGNSKSCTYKAVRPGSILASGNWQVEVWWNGTCLGEPDWVRSAALGHNNGPGGRGGSWDGSIAPGSCARAKAFNSGTFVLIGEVRP